MDQPTLFQPRAGASVVTHERLILYALGEFQARGKALVERDLPLDRLRGALRRASEALGVAELSDEEAAAGFDALGAQVRRVPPFVAKHPYRVTVPPAVAARAREVYEQQHAQQSDEAE